MKLRRKHILGLQEMDADEIVLALDTASRFKEVLGRPIRKVPALRGKTVCTLFFEPSTRTRASFEMAAKILSADTTSLTVAASSVSKGETLKDTILTMQAMGVDCFVIRHPHSGAPQSATKWVKGHVLNAGDGCHEHPTQGLLDLLTIREHKGEIGGLNVTIIGDLRHSRVARSGLWGLLKLGANVTLCGPQTLLPREFASYGARLESDCDRAVEDADVVMTLRLQNERMNGVYLPGVREFASLYGINAKRMKRAKPDAILMHPGPLNRGVEISDEMADSAQSVILEQVTNGVAVRMALLYLLLGGEE
jgi:aspartate carbamoyltransferase catalytic subunit